MTTIEMPPPETLPEPEIMDQDPDECCHLIRFEATRIGDYSEKRYLMSWCGRLITTGNGVMATQISASDRICTCNHPRCVACAENFLAHQ